MEGGHESWGAICKETVKGSFLEGDSGAAPGGGGGAPEDVWEPSPGRGSSRGRGLQAAACQPQKQAGWSHVGTRRAPDGVSRVRGCMQGRCHGAVFGFTPKGAESLQGVGQQNVSARPLCPPSLCPVPPSTLLPAQEALSRSLGVRRASPALSWGALLP